MSRLGGGRKDYWSRFGSSVLDWRAYSVTETGNKNGSDHVMVRAEPRLKKDKTTKSDQWFDIAKLKCDNTVDRFCLQLSNVFSDLEELYSSNLPLRKYGNPLSTTSKRLQWKRLWWQNDGQKIASQARRSKSRTKRISVLVPTTTTSFDDKPLGRLTMIAKLIGEWTHPKALQPT